MFNIWINDGTSVMPKDDILYIISKEGILLKKKLGLFESLAPVNNISILNEMDTYASLDVEKIPAKKFANIFYFFVKVFQEFRGEGNVILHYNRKRKKYRIEVPKQEVGGVSVSYESILSLKGYDRIGTIHSHPNFSASHSGIDHSDEESWDGLHITVGNVNSEHFSLSCSIMANGTRFMINPLDYIEGLEIEEYEVKSYSYNYSKQKSENDKIVTKLGYKLNVPISFQKFPRVWLKQVSKNDTPVYSKGMFANVGNTFYEGMNIPDLNPNSSSPYLDMVHDLGNDNVDDYNPCLLCPFKDYKSDALLKELYESLDDQELENLGFVETEEEGGEEAEENATLIVESKDQPEHLKQEGYGQY